MSLNSSELLWSWLKIIAALPIVLLLAYASFRFSRRYVNNFRKGLFIKVIETVPLFNKSAISIVQVGNKYWVLGVSDQGIRVISHLSEDEINELKTGQHNAGAYKDSLSNWANKIKSNLDDRRQEKE